MQSFKFLLILSWAIIVSTHQERLPPPTTTTTPLLFPVPTQCPPGGLPIRSAGPPGKQRLAPEEASYIAIRERDVLPRMWDTYLRNVEHSLHPRKRVPSKSTTGNHHRPRSRVGISFSGGSYRGATLAAGVISALDSRNSTAVNKGTGGVFQLITYASCSSGSSWMLNSWLQAGGPAIPDLIFPPPSNSNSNDTNVFGGWLPQIDLIQPLGNNTNLTIEFLEIVLEEVAPKAKSGLPITMADLFQQVLGPHFVNGTTADNVVEFGSHGEGIRLSQMPSTSIMLSHQAPLVITAADSIPPASSPNKVDQTPQGTVPIRGNEVWEFTPYEVGSYNPSLAHFIPTGLLGSTAGNSSCMEGFDQLGYLMATSSSVFLVNNVSGILEFPSDIFVELLEGAFGPQTGIRLDAAAVPNPFKGINSKTYSNTKEDIVYLVDGGLDGENIPLNSLSVRARALDVILAIDASADTEGNFPNGTSLINAAMASNQFPEVFALPTFPKSVEEIVEHKLNQQPTFFGCFEEYNSVPIVVYIPNRRLEGQLPLTNFSDLETQFNPTDFQKGVDQAFQIATTGRPGTNWAECLECALIERGNSKFGLVRSLECDLCFAEYCWS